MESVIKLIQEHYQWIFSGIGVFIIGLLVYKNSGQNQKISNNSSGNQAGGNISINSPDDKKRK